MSASNSHSDDPMVVATGFYEEMTRLWNEQGKTDTVPSMYTDDADLINALGPRWHGREQIAANTLGVVTTFRPTLSYELLSAIYLAPGVILAIGVGTATIPAGQANAGRHELSQSMIFVKQKGVWKVRFVQSTPVLGVGPQK